MTHTNINKIKFEIDRIHSEIISEFDIEVYIARLDQINDVVSGNKIFKLNYFIDDALKNNKKTIITKGGYYSNHLVATAFYTKENNLKSVGIIRGEEPSILSPTLKDCIKYGMEIHYVSRENYDNPSFLQILIDSKFENYEFIPEGGFDPKGAEGASLIMNVFNNLKPTHVVTAIGTATTIAGLIKNNSINAEIIGIPVLKGLTDIESRISYLLNKANFISPTIFHEYHFGGYAKYNLSLIEKMNEFYTLHKIPTDFVYTGKMIFALLDLIKKNYFKKGSKIIALHTGGLQGNQSLTSKTLVF